GLDMTRPDLFACKSPSHRVQEDAPHDRQRFIPYPLCIKLHASSDGTDEVLRAGRGQFIEQSSVLARERRGLPNPSPCAGTERAVELSQHDVADPVARVRNVSVRLVLDPALLHPDEVLA